MSALARSALSGWAIMIGLSIAVPAGMWLLAPARAPYNPDAFVAVREEERRCLGQDSPRTLTVQCQGLLEFVAQCAYPGDCTIDQTYDLMSKLGFSLPPLRTTQE